MLSGEEMKNFILKIKANVIDYWLCYFWGGVGAAIAAFFILDQINNGYFILHQHDDIILLDYFWVIFPVLILIGSSLFYCRGKKVLRKIVRLESELKRKDDEVGELNAFYKKIVDNVPVSILTLDKKGTVTLVNPYFDELAGEVGAKHLGRNIFSFSFVKRSEELHRRYKNLLYRGESFCYLNYPHTPSSDPRRVKYFNLFAVPLKRDGEIEGAISVAQDNTETFIAFEALKTKARQLHLVNQISRAVNSVLDLKEVLWLILRNAVKLTDALCGAILLVEKDQSLVVKEAYNMPPGWQHLKIKVGQGLCGHAAELMEPYFSNNVDEDPYYIRDPERENVKSELAIPIISEKKIIGVVKIDSDRTGRFTEEDVELLAILANNAAIAIKNSQLYGEIKNFNKTLEEEVSCRTKELEVMNEKLAKSIELKSQFIADASHELRTPLTVIKGNIDITLGNENSAKDDFHEALKLIDEETKHMSGILADLMILTHAGAGKLHLKREKIDLENLLKGAIQAMNILAKERKINLKVEIKNKITAFIDEDKILKLLLNLISNAIKYGNEGGWVKVCCHSDKDGYFITVSDNGIGIPEKDLPFIFERFYRVDKVRTRDQVGGSGLGLAICKSIIEAHGGSIEAKSRVGVGSEFIIQIPKDYIDFQEG
jgi:PAS domain S-box-containing protein